MLPARRLLIVSLAFVAASLRPHFATAQDSAELTFVKQFVTKHCNECHGIEKPKGEVSFAAVKDRQSIAQQRKLWVNVRTAIERGNMPPEDRPQPEKPERQKFLDSLDAVFKQIDREAKPDPGRVTMRRLNRTEYNNTVRDLTGIDFDPTEDFPSDDVGHGFDNIGDVLTLSPVLLERYVGAAESIMARAIMPNPPKPPNRGVGTQYTEPASANVPMKGGFRVVSGKPDGSPVDTGPIFTRYKVPSDGQYIAQTQLFIETTGTKPVYAAILAGCDKAAKGAATDEEAAKLSGAAVKSLNPFIILKTFEIAAREAKSAQVLKVDIPADIGLDKLAIALVKSEAGEPEATMHVKYISLEGPLDTRPASHRRLLAHSPDKTGAERTREVLTRFVTRAYRRTATDDEISRLMAFAAAQEAAGASWEAAMQTTLQAVLVSPKFLFRVELDSNPNAPEARPLNEFHLASRLSYFLWCSMPDDELLELARSGQLSSKLDEQVARMLKDPRANTLIDNFAMQWLQLKRLQLSAPDKQLFPAFNEPLRDAMTQETRLFLKEVLLNDHSLLDLIDGKFSFLNETLARHYRIADTQGTRQGQKPTRPGGQPIRGREFVRVDFEDGERGGLLTQASILTVTSNPTRTSPVKRGKWVLEQLLGAPPPAPPPNVPELEAQKEKLTGSLRQRMEQHRKNPACANCHEKMDALGFAFENFDGVGGFRLKDGDFDIDPAGTLPSGQSFKGPAELKSILKQDHEPFTRCLTEKLMIYALGRGIEFYDRPVVERVVKVVGEKDHKFVALVTEIVKSEPFRMRRGD